MRRSGFSCFGSGAMSYRFGRLRTHEVMVNRL